VKNQSFPTESTDAQKNLLAHVLNLTHSSIFKILKLLISTSLLLAVNGVMVVVFGFFSYGSTISPLLLLAAFLVTFAVYGLNKVTDRAEDSINQPETSPNDSGYYLVFSVASMLVGLSIGMLTGIWPFIVLLMPVIIGVIYSVRISKSIPRLKEVVGLKSIVVAVSWATTGCLLPGSVCVEQLQASAIVFLYILIRVLVGTILCDVLDKKGDSASGVETIPIRLGRNKTQKLLILVNSFGMLLSVYCATTGMFLRFVPVLIFGVFYGYMSIWVIFKDNCKRATAGLMLDGEWFPIVLIACVLVS